MRVSVDTFQVSFLFFLQRLIKRLPVNLPRVEFMNRKRERERERERGRRPNDLIHFYGTFLRFSLPRSSLSRRSTAKGNGRTTTEEHCEIDKLSRRRALTPPLSWHTDSEYVSFLKSRGGIFLLGDVSWKCHNFTLTRKNHPEIQFDRHYYDYRDFKMTVPYLWICDLCIWSGVLGRGTGLQGDG